MTAAEAALTLLVEAGKVVIVEVLGPWLRKRRRGEEHCAYVHACGLWCIREARHEHAHIDSRGHEWVAS